MRWQVAYDVAQRSYAGEFARDSTAHKLEFGGLPHALSGDLLPVFMRQSCQHVLELQRALNHLPAFGARAQFHCPSSIRRVFNSTPRLECNNLRLYPLSPMRNQNWSVGEENSFFFQYLVPPEILHAGPSKIHVQTIRPAWYCP